MRKKKANVTELADKTTETLKKRKQKANKNI